MQQLHGRTPLEHKLGGSDFSPKHAPAVRANHTSHVLARVRRNKQTAATTLAATLRSLLILDRFLRHLICACRIYANGENRCGTRSARRPPQQY